MHGGARLARHPDSHGLIAPSTRRLPIGAAPLGVAAVLAALVITAVVVAARGSHYLPVGDHALTELRVRDVGHHPVVAGLYSRDGWSHPGPMMFFLLAPLYRLAGGASVAIDLGAVLVNVVGVAGMGLVAHRRGGPSLLVCTLVGTALLLRALGAGFVADPWNTSITVLPFGLLVFLVWAMTCGDAWALPAGVVTATFLAQTHVGFVVLALPLLAVGAGWLVVDVVRRARGWRSLVRAAVVAVALGAVLWLPVLADAVNGAPDNLARVVDWFRHEHSAHSLLQGVRVVSGQLGGRPEWLVSRRPPLGVTGEPAYLYRAPFPWVLVLVVAAGALFVRRHVDGGVRLVAVVVCTCVVAVVAVMRTVGLAYDYRLRWTWVIGMVAAVVVAWAATVALERWRQLLAVVAAGSLVIACTVDVVAAASARPARAADSRVMRAIVPDVLREVGDVRGPVLVDDGPYELASDYGRGLLLQLERHGVDARMRNRDRAIVGDHRVLDGARVARHLVVAQDGEIAARDAEPGLRRIASWSSVTAAEVRTYRQTEARLDRLVAAGDLTPIEEAFRLRAIALGDHDPAFAWAIAVYVAS
ncbi:MAG: hypothetical protein QOD30_1947 [Actinomycetota bacterium]|nr:hypothetical protein [Actinomycetota bacterium]